MILRHSSTNMELKKNHIDSLKYLAHISEIKDSNQLVFSNTHKLNTYLEDAKNYKEEIISLQKHNAFVLKNHIQPDILSKIQSINSTDCDFIILKKFPFTDMKNVNEAEQVLIGLSYLLGLKPFSYVSEYQGRLIHQIKPKKEKENDYHSASSMSDLEFHNENSFDNNRPDFLMLYCLKSDKNAATTFLSVRKLFESLSEEQKIRFLSIGLKNIFLHLSSNSHECNPIKNQSSLFSYNLSSKMFPIEMRYSPLTIGLNQEANDLLVELRSIIDYLKTEIVLESGDVCIWFNHGYLHGRSAYKPDFNNEKNIRFLLRMFLSRNFNLPMIRK